MTIATIQAMKAIPVVNSAVRVNVSSFMIRSIIRVLFTRVNKQIPILRKFVHMVLHNDCIAYGNLV
jgi:hypothetical protein